MEPVERIHQCVQGTGSNSSVQGYGEVGGIPAISAPFVIPNINVDARFRLTPSLLSLGLRARSWNCASDYSRQKPINATQEEFRETPPE